MAKSRPILIVQRHDYERLRGMCERFRREGATVVPDRRALDRRSPDRRKAGRRTKWTAKFPTSTFMVVPEDVSTEWVAPAPNDVLITKAAVEDHEYNLSVVPGSVQAKYDVYELAVERSRRFASFAHVDLWYTEDQTTFVLLGMFRPTPAAEDEHEERDDQPV